MKRLVLPSIFLAASAGMFSCGKTTTINSNMELTGKWVLESVVQNEDTIRKPGLTKGQMEVSLLFKDKGELEATSSTNFLTGYYETSQDNEIQLGGGGTERAETSWGDLFVNALPAVNQYDLSAEKLVLYYENNNALIFNKARLR
ncbi:META domain-containing protein [Dyadobacter sandarakinus]|uniref:META domain-containing protein n=1 Tax=Dyadobacter sandarakinus TaxID=2747268 RepID=A0ABX7IBP4_9BACT|nr:META domain-containing protein [Dyadobacter sandarakinus]QRR02346.1 META domain-containing protein [Dyadobacter sandarakinus]